jgi:hypothetical protein
LASTGDFGFGAVLAYNSGNKLNNSTIPETDNEGNTGKGRPSIIVAGCTQTSTGAMH